MILVLYKIFAVFWYNFFSRVDFSIIVTIKIPLENIFWI